MSPIQFPRVKIVSNNITGFLTNMILQEAGHYLYEIKGDDGKIYTLKDSEFIRTGDGL